MRRLLPALDRQITTASPASLIATSGGKSIGLGAMSYSRELANAVVEVPRYARTKPSVLKLPFTTRTRWPARFTRVLALSRACRIVGLFGTVVAAPNDVAPPA